MGELSRPSAFDHEPENAGELRAFFRAARGQEATRVLEVAFVVLMTKLDTVEALLRRSSDPVVGDRRG